MSNPIHLPSFTKEAEVVGGVTEGRGLSVKEAKIWYHAPGRPPKAMFTGGSWGKASGGVTSTNTNNALSRRVHLQNKPKIRLGDPFLQMNITMILFWLENHSAATPCFSVSQYREHTWPLSTCRELEIFFWKITTEKNVNFLTHLPCGRRPRISHIMWPFGLTSSLLLCIRHW